MNLGDALVLSKALSIPSLSIRSGGRTPSFAPGSYHAWDFISKEAWFAGVYRGALENTPNLSMVRASGKYVKNAAGVLVWVAANTIPVAPSDSVGALIEGARTNLCLQSQTMDNAYWDVKAKCSVTANAVAAPDGTATADKFVEDNTTGEHTLGRGNITASNATVYTVSIFAKAGERTKFRFGPVYGFNNAQAFVDLGAGTVGTTSGGTAANWAITALGNGWYRISVTDTSNATEVDPAFSLVSTGTTTNYAGDSASGLYLWGAQLEAGSFPSSYIPTTSASATRAADVLTVTSPGVDYPLTLFAEYSLDAISASDQTALQMDDGSANNRAILYRSTGTSTVVAFASLSGGALQGLIGPAGAPSIGVTVKGAGRVTLNDIQAARAGVLGPQDTSATNPATPTKISFGYRNSNQDPLCGYIRRAAIFNYALSDAQLQAITT